MSEEKKRRKILLFQHDTESLELIRGIADERGFEVDVADDIIAGLNRVMDFTPDLIFADLDSTDYSVFDILDGVSERKLRVPVIVTGQRDIDRILHAFRQGVTDYIPKPVDRKLLGTRIDVIAEASVREKEDVDEKNIRQLLANMEKDNRELNALLEITSSFNVTGSSKKELLNRLTEVAADTMHCEAASIMLINERRNSLEFVVATGEKKTRLETMSIPMSEGVAGWVAIHGKPQIVNDTTKDPRFTGSVDKESGFVTRQILAVPLRIEGTLIGVLEVINTRDNRMLGNDDIRMLGDIGERAATVIVAARTIEEQQNFYVQTTNIIVKAIEKKDMFSIGHPWQVAEICHKIGLKMALSDHEMSDLHFGSLLHDIGKLEMPSILFNKRSLSERELEFIRQHPVKGAKLLEPITIWNGVVPYILYHHESWDGSGYPFGRHGESIPLGARIINLAEAFSVMRSPNSYKRRMSIKEAILEVMRMSGKQFDPDIVKAFVSVLEKDITVR